MAASQRRVQALTAVGVAIASLIPYLCTAGDGPYWQDSGIFLAGLYLGGGLYPPGFPLYILLGRPLVGLLTTLGLPFTYAVHCYSALAGAAAAAIVTCAVFLVARPGYVFFRGAPAANVSEDETPHAGPPLHVTLLAAVAGLMCGWSYSLWFQSITAEVYALQALFAAATWYCVLRLAAEGPLTAAPSPVQRRWCYLLVAVYGLSYANHPSTIVFVPPLLVLLWTQRALLANGALCARLAALFLGCGFVPYLYLPVAAALDPTLQYGSVTTLGGFWDHVSGRKWTGEGGSYGLDGWRLAHLPVQWWRELFVVGLPAVPAGVWAWWRHGGTARAVLIAFAVPALALPVSYLQGTEYDFWFLPLYVTFFLLAGGGLLAVWRHWSPPNWALALLAPAALLPPLLVNWSHLDRRTDHVPEDFARNLLRFIPENGILFAASDQECSLSLYQQVVRGERPDVVVIQSPVLPSPWYEGWLRARYPTLNVPDSQGAVWSENRWIEALIRSNPERPALLSKVIPMQLLEGQQWVPVGGLWRFIHQGEYAIDPRHWAYEYRNADPFAPTARRHYQRRVAAKGRRPAGIERIRYVDEVRGFHQQAWFNLARVYLRSGAPKRALAAYERMLTDYPQLESAQIWADAAILAREQNRPALAERWMAEAQKRRATR